MPFCISHSQMSLFLFTPPPLSAITGLRLAGHLLSDYAHIIDQRITTPTPPPWMSPAVSNWLLSLSDHELNECESLGFSAFVNKSTTAPPVMKQFAQRASKINAHFPLLSAPDLQPSSLKKRLRPIKQAQIHRVTRLANHIISSTSSPVTRIVDVGAGHAHLASHLADHLSPQIPVVAIDRDDNLISTARALHSQSSLSFVSTTVDAAIPTAPGDFLVGLHACGSLGDVIVHTAAAQNVSGVLLVSCCLQKLQPMLQRRFPLSRTAREDQLLHNVLHVHRNSLGITNRSRGYVSEKAVLSRETRYALRQLLNSNGVTVQRIGDEVVGISRHRLHKGLAEVISDVFASRGLAHVSFSPAELKSCADEAKIAYRMMRALTLPRALAGEILEMAIVLDRAALLEESERYGSLLTCRLWDDSLSVRNLCCAAW